MTEYDPNHPSTISKLGWSLTEESSIHAIMQSESVPRAEAIRRMQRRKVRATLRNGYVILGGSLVRSLDGPPRMQEPRGDKSRCAFDGLLLPDERVRRHSPFCSESCRVRYSRAWAEKVRWAA